MTQPDLTWSRVPPKSHLQHIGWFMRADDQRELFAGNGESPVVTVLESWVASKTDERFVFYWKKEPTWVCGLVHASDDVGIPWMVATDTWGKVPTKSRWELSQWFIQHWLQDYPLLANYVDARNGISRDWLARLGAEETEIVPHGPFRTPFIRFEIKQCVTP